MTRELIHTAAMTACDDAHESDGEEDEEIISLDEGFV